MTTIDLTPTREGYINMLKLLIENSTNAEDVVWAKEELTKLEEQVQPVSLRAPESPLFEGTWEAFDKLMAEALAIHDAVIARRKQPVLQEHFEQLGLDLGLMDKPNEN